MNSTSCCAGNGTLWILILAFVLSDKNFNLSNLFEGCGLPLLLALLFCMGRNGSLSNLIDSLFGNNHNGGCGCGCGCN
jgi:hypothetical protein